jgi:hypothetical protein
MEAPKRGLISFYFPEVRSIQPVTCDHRCYL